MDLSNPDSFEHGFPHDHFRRLRKEDPVHWHEGDIYGGPGYWVLSRYDDIKWVSKNPKLFVSGRGNLIEQRPDVELDVGRSMITMDPPAHPRYRKIVSQAFTPQRIRDLEAKTYAIVDDILDRVAGKGECDFVRDVAAELPLQIICEFLGVPQEDSHRIFEWSNALIGTEDPEYSGSEVQSRVAAIEMLQYAYQLGQKRLAEPKEDLITALLLTEVDGERLEMLEWGMFFVLLSIAGNETTRNLISHGLWLLIENPEARARLIAEPTLIPSAVEEMLRYRAPVMYFRRTAKQDTEVAGRKIREGDKLTLWYPSANRDESMFSEPDRFDIARHPNDHLAFGVGQHFCLGAHLARLEIRVMFERLLSRLPDMELAGPVRTLRSHFIDGIKSMPVEFTPAPDA
jgi:cholest-4-en-3-one 26-monooxygenase